MLAKITHTYICAVLIISHASSTTSFTASLKMSIPFARSTLEIFNGSMNRTVSYPDVGSKRRPFPIQRLINLIFIGKLVDVPFTVGSKVGCEGGANSTAIIKPCPRMSRMCGPTVESAFSAFKALNSSADLKNWLRIHGHFGGIQTHRALTFSRIFSSLNVSATAMAAAHDTAFPEYVPPCHILLGCKVF